MLNLCHGLCRPRSRTANLAPTRVRLHRFAAEEYERTGELGVLTAEDRVEPLGGIIVDKEMTDPPLALDADSRPEPDLASVRRPPTEAGRHPGPADVFLLIEVAESSLDADRGEKLFRYAQAGIVENIGSSTCPVVRSRFTANLIPAPAPAGRPSPPGPATLSPRPFS